MAQKQHNKSGGLCPRLSKILGISSGSIRGRISYHKLSSKTTPFEKILDVLPPDLVHKNRSRLNALKRELSAKHNTPPINPNPAADAHEDDVINIPLARAALVRAARAYGTVTLQEMDDVASGIADALKFLGGAVRHRRKS